MDLPELQRGFLTLLRSMDPPRSDNGVGIKDCPPIPLSRRLEIYHYAFWARQRESLAEDFPRTRSLVGENEFETLVQAYLTAHPSRWSSLAELGREFPGFLKTHNSHATCPYLADVARFEWAEFEASYAPEPPERNLELLAGLTERDWNDVVFGFHPSVQLIESLWRVDRMRRKPRTLKPKPARFLVHAVEGDVRTETLNGAEVRLFKLMRDGHTVGALKDAIRGEQRTMDQSLAFFSHLAAVGIVTHFRVAPKAS